MNKDFDDYDDYEDIATEIRALSKKVREHLDHVAQHVETMMRQAEDQQRRANDERTRRHLFMILMLLLKMMNEANDHAHAISESRDEYESAPAPRRMR